MTSATAKLQLLIELKNKLNAAQLRTSVRQAFNGLENEIPLLGRAMNVLRNPLAGVAAGAVAVGTGLYQSVKSAAEWNNRMAEINVTAQQTPAGLQKLSAELLKIGGRNANNLDEVPKAFGAIPGATDDVEKSLATLEPVPKASKAGYVDIETAAKAATAVMGSAGVDGTKALDTIIATVKAGNAGFQDVANYMPKIIPVANPIGLKLGETSGAFAQLTKSLPAEAAATSLQGVMRALSNLAGLSVGLAVFNAGKIAVLGYVAAMKIASVATGLFNAIMSISPLGWVAIAIGAVIAAVTICYNRFDKFRAIVQGSWEVLKAFGAILKDFVIDRIKGLISGIGTIGSAFQKLFSGNFAGAWEDAKKGFVELSGIEAAKKAFESTKGLKDNFTNKYDEVLADAAKKKAEESEGDFAGIPGTPTSTATIPANNNKGGLDDARKISSESQTKNITINIDSFIKGFSSTNQTVNNMNPAELETWMTEMFLRVVRSAEMAM
jgi:hypothetical protein